MNYRTSTWKEYHRVTLKAIRPAEEILFKCEFWVADLSRLVIFNLFKTYHKRGAVENSIEEAKTGFFMDRTDRHEFITNTIKMALSILAYNIL